MAEIHAQKSDGTWLIGMEAFREVYNYTPYSTIFNLTKLPVVKEVFDFFYKVFAKYRLKITGRNEECSINL